MAVTLTIQGVIPVRPPDPWQHPLSLVVEEDSFLTIRTLPILGTRLFRLILGADTVARGTISLFGTSPADLDRRGVRQMRSRVGSVLVPDGLVGNMTVRKNLSLPLIFAAGISAAEVDRKVDRVMDAFGLESIALRRPAMLPADVRQVVALARAVVGNPALLLLDDPLASVGTVEMGGLLAMCRHFATTVIAITHRRNQVLYDSADDVALWDEEGFRMAGQTMDQVAS